MKGLAALACLVVLGCACSAQQPPPTDSRTTPPRAVASDSPAATPDVGPGNPAASSDAAPVRVAARYAFPVR
ncbi:MAG: hypothetical protein ACRDOJ_01390, partial [Nocardioidaceae bacterium]